MRVLLRAIGLVLALSTAAAPDAGAGQPPIRVEFAADRVSVHASDAGARDVLAAWAAAGGTEFVGVERLAGRRVTLSLDGVGETEALAEIAGPAFGIAGWERPAPGGRGLSRFARVAIVPAARPRSSGGTATEGPPEARFSYPEPARARAATDLGLPTEPTATPVDPAGRPAPESVFEYFQPARAVPPPAGPLMAEPASVREAGPAAGTVDPEARFDYFLPARAVSPRDPETGEPAAPNAGSATLRASPAPNAAPPAATAPASSLPPSAPAARPVRRAPPAPNAGKKESTGGIRSEAAPRHR